MKPYNINDFHNKDAWLIFRMDAQIKNDPIDIYMIMDLKSMFVFHHEIVLLEISEEQLNKLLDIAKSKKGLLPQHLLLAKGDPAEKFLQKYAEILKINLELVPAPYLEDLTAPVRESFDEYLFSKSSTEHPPLEDEIDELDRESAKRMIPDTYDPCSCASGKKYKFCCKNVFREIVEAMVSSEEGKISEALDWIDKAKAIAGETAEILCREAIVYSYTDIKKSEEILEKCLAANPRHPRAHYIRGITLKEKGDFQGAIVAYETAIANYPPSDQFHLNEAYNNLGSVFLKLGDYAKAKSAWEQALLYLPSDKAARYNLNECIYNNPRAGSH